jgi:hypothetical protein
MDTQLSREQLLSKISELNRRNDILRSELLRYKLFCNYLEKTIKVLQKYRNENELNINIDYELNRNLFIFKSIKLCEIKLNKLQNGMNSFLLLSFCYFFEIFLILYFI